MVEPLATAPWPDDPTLPGILRKLRGEWPCVPFGTEGKVPLPPRWPTATGKEVPPHGYASNNHWEIVQEPDRLVATIRYPDSDPIESLTRTLKPDGAGVGLTLQILPRADCQIPIALHPVLRLPETTGAVLLDIGPHSAVWSHPQTPPADPCPLATDFPSPTLSLMERANGGKLDLTHLPLAEAAECRVLILNAAGFAELTHLAEGWRVRLDWKAHDFPGLMLWVSNRGRSQYPWNGRHMALGVEPCRAAFDLGTTVSRAANPVAETMSTALTLKAGVLWETHYRIWVEPATA
jgi:hypothetical protein